jgi:hypothetical protein
MHKGIDIPKDMISTYYEDGPTGSFCCGQIVWIPSLYPNKDKEVLDIDVASDPSEEYLHAKISPLDRKQHNFPVKSLELGTHEHLFVMKGKLRPAIILTEGFTRWPTLSSEPVSLCVPFYTVDKLKISQAFVVQAQAFQYPSKFYIHPHTAYGIEESVARFELIQPIHQYAMQPLSSTKRCVMLSDEYRWLLQLHLSSYFGCVLSEADGSFLSEYGKIILEEARKQGIKCL